LTISGRLSKLIPFCETCFAESQLIEWKYSTDRAPWCGGYWERLVRMMKNALRKVLGKALLRSWELHTVLC
ncbi:hypothetical protein T08_6876, partial [Trichinella sp. T8]